jgi:hypothetical protein
LAEEGAWAISARTSPGRTTTRRRPEPSPARKRAAADGLAELVDTGAALLLEAPCDRRWAKR